ncbi:aminomethyl transferase family protein, partial [Bacillus cereus]
MSNQINVQEETNEAYDAVRNGIGVIDLSTTGRIVVKGEDHVEFLDRLVTKDIIFMEEETTLFTLLLQEDGTVIDIINLFKNEDSLTVITTPHKKEMVLAWLQNQKPSGVEIIDISQTHSQIGFEGPYAWKLAQKFL